MVGDELDPRGYVLRRSSSAWAKYANAFRRISIARFSSRTSRSSSFNRSPSRSGRRLAVPQLRLLLGPRRSRVVH